MGSGGGARSHNLTINRRALCQLSYPGSKLPQTLAQKIAIDAAGCWIWTGARQTNGYGSACIPGTGRSALAHRLVYELLVAPIPEGLQIDHLCRVKACVNPKHLEPVTAAENNRRGRIANSFDGTGRIKTECPMGHDTTAPDSRSGGYCKRCKNADQRVREMRARPTRTASLIRQLMRRARVSQTELGLAMSLSQIGVSRRLRGVTPLTPEDARFAYVYLTNRINQRTAQSA